MKPAGGGSKGGGAAVVALLGLLISGAAAGQGIVTSCLPGPGDEIRCRTMAEDGSSTVRIYRPNPFGDGYQQESHVQRPLPEVGLGSRKGVEPLPPPRPVGPVKVPKSGGTMETWVPPSRPSPSDAFLK